jgi:hypothetical protein
MYFMLAKCTAILLSLLLNLWTQGQISISLRKTFIDSIKNKITIKANYQIYFAHKHANAAANDGDLHFAGYDRKIGLPIVAEIMNAKDQTDAVALVHQKEGNGTPSETVALTGVWRLWCEHPGDIFDFKQGKNDIAIENTNPPHVFEIHPAIKIDDLDLSPSLHEINDFKYKDAEDAFGRYANLRCKLSKKGKYVLLETNGIGYNYVDFWIKLNSDSKLRVTDGLFAYCSVYNSSFDPEDPEEDNLISHKLRIGFIKGSVLYAKIDSLSKGSFVHVVGIPRIDLALVSWRIEHATDRPEALEWNLPLEMIAVGELD